MKIEEWQTITGEQIYDLLDKVERITVANCSIKEVVFNFRGTPVRITSNFDTISFAIPKREDGTTDE